MKTPLLIAYGLAGLLIIWSIFAGNLEFVFYGITALVIVLILHLSHKKFTYPAWIWWLFVLWIILHIIGGLVQINGHAMYSQMLISIVGDPYYILKYDQVVHSYCYFVVALILWQVVSRSFTDTRHHPTLATILVVLAASGIGGMNEIIEFLATVFIQDVNVGGYENTALDIVANLVGALLAIPFFRKGQ